MAATPTAHPPSLRHHRPFRRLWAGQAVSAFGSMVGGSALDFTAILFLRATPFQLGILSAATMAPVLLVGLLAGVWVDRLPRRPILVGAEVGRALLLATIPLAAALGRLSFAQLVLVAAGVGVLAVFFSAAFHAFLPSVVARAQLVEANSRLSASEAVAESLGPGIAGALVAVASAPLVLLADALSFAVSAFSLWGLRGAEAAPERPGAPTAIWQDIKEGLDLVARDPIQRALAGVAVTTGFFGGIIGALYSVFALRELGLSPFVLGVTIGAGGIGALAGAGVAARLERRFGVGRTLWGALLWNGALQCFIPLAGGALAAPMLLAAQIFGDIGGSVFSINERALRQTITPDRLLGRVSASRDALVAVALPLGALAGGWLGQTVGLRPTLGLGVAGIAAATLWLLASPLRTLSALPESATAGAPTRVE